MGSETTFRDDFSPKMLNLLFHNRRISYAAEELPGSYTAIKIAYVLLVLQVELVYAVRTAAGEIADSLQDVWVHSSFY